jgi:two-component system, chemotaxis family, CheB/CheR fusion protein
MTDSVGPRMTAVKAAARSLKAGNDELSRLNAEMRQRSELLSQVNSDLANFLASAHLALVVVGPDLRLRRFTSEAERLLNLAAADEGKPIRDLTVPLAISNLEARLTDVINSAAVEEHEVQDNEGRWYSLRLRPYRSADNTIDGAVMVLVDIDAQKRIQAAIRESEQQLRMLADNAPVHIWIDGVQGREFVNRT